MGYTSHQIEHHYPEQIVLLQNPYISTLLTRLSQKACRQPFFNNLLRQIYRSLMVEAFNLYWPTLEATVATRMAETHPEAQLTAPVFSQDQKAVIVDMARAGMVPAQMAFDFLNELVEPQGIRQDHIFASRVCDDKNQVTHTELSSSKIGGDVDGALVFLPDPMGATGKSLCEVISHYKKQVSGTARRYIGIHLIVTPEFIRNVTESHPDVVIVAGRVDRGLSPQSALLATPGQHWDSEIGLNNNQYIVPGAGGVGEIINNSFI